MRVRLCLRCGVARKHYSAVHRVPLKLALTCGGACNPCNRSGREAGVTVEKLHTTTERIPASTGIPAWVTSPPNTKALPRGGFNTRLGFVDGFSSTRRFPAQNPVPPLQHHNSTRGRPNVSQLNGLHWQKQANDIPFFLPYPSKESKDVNGIKMVKPK